MTEQFEILEHVVKTAVQQSSPEKRAELMELLPFLSSLKRSRESLPALKETIENLKKQTDALGAPPLQQGIFIRFSRTGQEEGQFSEFDAEPRAVVGVDGRRYEVRIADGAHRERLREGCEVVLNNHMVIVGVRDAFLQGGAAEVIDILSPVGAARIDRISENKDMVVIDRYEEGVCEAPCDPELLKVLRRGDIVKLDDRGNCISRVKPRLHILMEGAEGAIVEISDRLFLEGVEIGDMVRVDLRLLFAFDKLPAYGAGQLTLETIPDVEYKDIGGLDRAIEKLRDAVELPYIHRNLFKSYKLSRPRGVFLFGPPGCGKTMIAKALANSIAARIRNHLSLLERRLRLYFKLRNCRPQENVPEEYVDLMNRTFRMKAESNGGFLVNDVMERLGQSLLEYGVDIGSAETAYERIISTLRREDGVRGFFVNVKGPELLNKYVGETERRIRKIFENAKRKASFHTPVIVFFDEMEALFRSRGSGRSSDVETTIVPQLLSDMDGVETFENIIVIGASNRPDMIDPAIMRPGRFDVKIRIDRPNRKMAQNIMALHLTPDLPLLMKKTDIPETGSDFHFKRHVVETTLAGAGGVTDEERAAVLNALPRDGDLRSLFQMEQSSIESFSETMVQFLRDAAQKEQIVDEMILRALDIIYHPDSHLAAVTAEGRRLIFSLDEFISGAALFQIAERAKKRAVKRRIAGDVPPGVHSEDLVDAVRSEFEENAEQLAMARIEEEYGVSASSMGKIRMVEIHLEI